MKVMALVLVLTKCVMGSKIVPMARMRKAVLVKCVSLGNTGARTETAFPSPSGATASPSAGTNLMNLVALVGQINGPVAVVHVYQMNTGVMVDMIVLTTVMKIIVIQYAVHQNGDVGMDHAYQLREGVMVVMNAQTILMKIIVKCVGHWSGCVEIIHAYQ